MASCGGRLIWNLTRWGAFTLTHPASDLGTQAPPVLWRGGGRSLQPCSLAGVAGSLLALVLSWLGCSVSQGLLPLPGDVCGWYTGHLLSLSPHLCNPHPAGNALVSPREGR